LKRKESKKKGKRYPNSQGNKSKGARMGEGSRGERPSNKRGINPGKEVI